MIYASCQNLIELVKVVKMFSFAGVYCLVVRMMWKKIPQVLHVECKYLSYFLFKHVNK